MVSLAQILNYGSLSRSSLRKNIVYNFSCISTLDLVETKGRFISKVALIGEESNAQKRQKCVKKKKDLLNFMLWVNVTSPTTSVTLQGLVGWLKFNI